MRVKPLCLAALCALGAAPFQATAQTSQTTPMAPTVASSSDANAPVLAPLYRSVFLDLEKGVVTDTLDWKKANEEVGRFTRGHIDVLKWEESEAAKRGPSTEPKPAAAGKP